MSPVGLLDDRMSRLSAGIPHIFTPKTNLGLLKQDICPRVFSVHGSHSWTNKFSNGWIFYPNRELFNFNTHETSFW